MKRMKKKNSYLLSFDDIETFLKCPRLYYKFDPKPEQPQLQDIIERCVIRTFAFALERGKFPDYYNLKFSWGKIVHPLVESGYLQDKKNSNDFNIGLKQLYDLLRTIAVGGKMSVVGIKFTADYVLEKGIYRGEIPVLFENSGKLYALYVHRPGTNYPTRNNKIRYSAAITSARIGVPVEGYFLLKPSPEYKSFTVHFFRFSKNEHSRSLREIELIVKTMFQNIDIPNTTYCNKCSFINKCTL
jgi:hypothetical protein